MSNPEDRGWNAAIHTMIGIADASAARIPSSVHRDFARAVLIQLAHDARHLLIGPPTGPMTALPEPEPNRPITPDDIEAAEEMMA